MTSPQWQRVDALLDKAMELPPPERTDFLDRECNGDSALRREVESLLAAHDQASGFFETPPVTEMGEVFNYALHEDLSGKHIGPYRLIRELGRGGMGVVYLAEDTRLRRKVALKVLPQTIAADTNHLRRFKREAFAASALNHPNILTIFEFGTVSTEVGETHFLAAEYVQGETLRARLQRARLTLSEMSDITIQIASALHVAHEAGIIHRDIKPENLMLRSDGIVKVLDFGLAKLLANDEGAKMKDEKNIPHSSFFTSHPATTPGLVMGTIAYMSPEQTRGAEVDSRTDIFSLGVVLYEMIAGWSPFKGETTSDIIAAILTTEPPLLTLARPETPAELQRIVGKTIRKNRDERYQSCKDLLIDLKELKSDLDISAKLTHNTVSVKTEYTEAATPAPSTVTIAPRRFSLRSALMVLLLLLMAAAWWFAGRDEKSYSLASLKSVEITSWPSSPGEHYSVGTFSPDGKFIAFASTRSGSMNIWLKQSSSDGAIQITNDEFANENPIWSSNGDEIAFFSIRGNHPGIWRTPVFGRTPALVTALQGGDARLRRWSKDGKKIYYELKRNLFAVDLRTGQTTQLTNLDQSNIDAYSLSISPDEQHIAYISTTQDGRSNVWVALVSGGLPWQIANDAGHNRNTVWHPDSKRIFYSANVDGVYQIFMGGIDGSKSVQITGSDVNSFALDVSPDGARILYGSTKEESDVWEVKVAGGAESALTSDLGSEFWPEVSPDGKTIAYQAARNLSQGDKIISNCSIMLRQDNSEEPRPFANDGTLPKWSPDGNQIAFMRLVGGTPSLWVTRAVGGSDRRLATDGLPTIEYTLFPYLRVQTSSFGWAPDAKKIVYISDRSGQQNVWAVAADGSSDAQITGNNDPNLSVNCPLWSADGKLIAYTTKPNESPALEKFIYTMWVTDVENKESKTVFRSGTFLRLIGWSRDGKELILATIKGRASSSRPTEVELVRVSIATGEQRPIAKLQSAYLYNIHLSYDRRTIAFTSRQDGKDNIWLISSSGGEAKKLTANNDAKLYFSSLSWSPDGRAIYFGKQSRHSVLLMITNFK